MTKTCKKCKQIKDITDFHKAAGCKYGRRPECKICKKKYEQQHYSTNKQDILRKNKRWKTENPDLVYLANKKWKAENSEREQLNNKQYIENNREYIRRQRSSQQKQRRETDSLYKIRKNLSCLVKNSYRGGGYSKSSKTQDIVGLCYQQLLSYLESTFVENYGILPQDWGWDDIHIDHIIPISLANSEHEITCLNHFSNLQLLTSYDNIIKSDKE